MNQNFHFKPDHQLYVVIYFNTSNFFFYVFSKLIIRYPLSLIMIHKLEYTTDWIRYVQYFTIFSDKKKYLKTSLSNDMNIKENYSQVYVSLHTFYWILIILWINQTVLQTMKFSAHPTFEISLRKFLPMERLMRIKMLRLSHDQKLGT